MGKIIQFLKNILLWILGKNKSLAVIVDEIGKTAECLNAVLDDYNKKMADGKLTIDEVLELVYAINTLMGQLNQIKAAAEELTKK